MKIVWIGVGGVMTVLGFGISNTGAHWNDKLAYNGRPAKIAGPLEFLNPLDGNWPAWIGYAGLGLIAYQVWGTEK